MTGGRSGLETTPVKKFLTAFLLLVGAVLGWRAYSAPDPDWAPIEMPENTGTPARVLGAIPAGYELVEYEVEGMHCGA